MTTSLSPEVYEFGIGHRLRRAREVADLDQAELAEAIDQSRATISNYENGHVRPRRITLKAWALRTGVPLEWIETGQSPAAAEERDRFGSDLSVT